MDALPTSRKAPTPSASSSRVTPPLTTERGEMMIQPSQCSAPTATRPRLRKRPPGRSPAGCRADHSPVRNAPRLGREPTSPLCTGTLIRECGLQNGGQGGGWCLVVGALWLVLGGWWLVVGGKGKA